MSKAFLSQHATYREQIASNPRALNGTETVLAPFSLFSLGMDFISLLCRYRCSFDSTASNTYIRFQRARASGNESFEDYKLCSCFLLAHLDRKERIEMTTTHGRQFFSRIYASVVKRTCNFPQQYFFFKKPKCLLYTST